MTWSATDRDSMGRTTAVESSPAESTSTSLFTARIEINYTGAPVFARAERTGAPFPGTCVIYDNSPSPGGGHDPAQAMTGRKPLTSQAEQTREEIIARNLAAVEVHFHNETPETIDKAISVYTDDIVWEVPARGLVHRNVADVKAEYLKIFGSMKIHKITNLYRFANEEWVFDDSIFEWTITGDGFANCPFPPGTTVSIRLLHAFQCRDGKICRENGYEIWRDINDTARVRDDIPATATVQVFD
jgi:hypothetical protein